MKARAGVALRWAAPAVCVCLALAAPARGDFLPVESFPVAGAVWSMATGPEGAVWIVAGEGRQLSRVGTDGKQQFITLSEPVRLDDLATGADGNLWVTTPRGVARITPAGQVTRFALPRSLGGSTAITAGPGGLWLLSWRGRSKTVGEGPWTGPAYVSRVSYEGAIVSFELPGPAGSRAGEPDDLTVGPDGNVWVADTGLDRIDRLAPDGEIRSFRLHVSPAGITSGPDGALWFTALGEIGRMTTSGEVTEFPGGYSGKIVAGPDGNLWFGGPSAGVDPPRVGRITPWGQLTWFGDTSGSPIYDILAGSDGHIWAGIVEGKTALSGAVYRISPGAPGLAVSTTKLVLREGKVKIEIECGGSPARGCSGRLELRSGGLLVGETAYAVPPERRQALTLAVSPRAEALLSRSRFLFGAVSATVNGGEGVTQGVALRIPHPLARPLRRGQLVRIPVTRSWSGAEIVRGLGGDFWLSDSFAGRLQRLTPEGRLSFVDLPVAVEGIGALTAGPLHSMWFGITAVRRGRSLHALARITASRKYSEIPLPGNASVSDVVFGSHGDIWLARSSYKGGEIDRLTSNGKVLRRWRVREPVSLVHAAGSLWFTAAGPTIGRIGRDGRVDRFAVSGGGYVGDMVRGPAGSLWFTHHRDHGGPAIASMTSRGKVKEFSTHLRGHRGGDPISLAFGPEGNLWFSEAISRGIGRLTPRGRVKHFFSPPTTAPTGIAFGPEGNLWFGTFSGAEVGVFRPPG